MAIAEGLEQGLSTSRREFFGPWVVRGAFMLGFFAWGVGFYGPPVFLHEVVRRTGWSIAMVSVASTLHFLVGAGVISMLPRVYARYGIPATIVVGAVVATVGSMGWALASQPWQLFASACLSGMGWVTMGSVAINAVVSPWYVRARPSALGKAFNGASVGGVIFSPLWVFLITALGFATAAGLIGAVMVVSMAVLGRWIFLKTPEGTGQLPDGAVVPVPDQVKERNEDAPPVLAFRWRNRVFLTLALGTAIGVFAQAGLVAHLFSLLAPTLGERSAGFLMGCVSGAAVLGRSLAAAALARVNDRRAVAAASFTLQAMGAMVLLLAGPGRPGLIVVGVLLFGLGIGNAGSMPPLIAQADFAVRDVQRVVALVAATSQGTYAFAPALFGFMLSAAGGTSTSGIGERTIGLFVVAALLQLVAATSLLVGRRRTRRERPQSNE